MYYGFARTAPTSLQLTINGSDISTKISNYLSKRTALRNICFNKNLRVQLDLLSICCCAVYFPKEKSIHNIFELKNIFGWYFVFLFVCLQIMSKFAFNLYQEHFLQNWAVSATNSVTSRASERRIFELMSLTAFTVTAALSVLNPDTLIMMQN